jgi:HAE1 family hydrophobic/amphiphilic exporter-1
LQEDNRNSINDVLDFTIPTPTGATVKLSEICSVDEYWAPPTIKRKERQRIVTVKVTPHEISLGELAQIIESGVISKMDIPSGYSVRIAGDYEEQQETFAKMGMLGLLIIILVYIVMASQFESFIKPGIIMFTVPFALSGVVIALWLTGTSLDMIGALGLVLLVGIVVKNGIVLVDYINLMRERGYELNTAIQMSGESRLRPVLMTAFTTVLGMVPMAISQGEGAEMWQPLGIVVIGGLTISTFLTLYIVPVLYAVVSRKGERDKLKKVREQFIFMDIKVKDCEENEKYEPKNNESDKSLTTN